jgi:hypothetical protein
MESNDIDADNPRGSGLEVQPDAAGVAVLISNNVFSHEASAAPWGNAFDFTGGATGGTFTNNIICQWDDPTEDFNGTNVISNNVINSPSCNGLGPAPERTIETYDLTLGGPGTLDHFMSLARQQSRDHWNPALTAQAVNTYIRAGFGR